MQTVYVATVIGDVNDETRPMRALVAQMPPPPPGADASLVKFENGSVGFVHGIYDTREEADAWQRAKQEALDLQFEEGGYTVYATIRG